MKKSLIRLIMNIFPMKIILKSIMIINQMLEYQSHLQGKIFL